MARRAHWLKVLFFTILVFDFNAYFASIVEESFYTGQYSQNDFQTAAWGMVWEDINNNGIKDFGELGIDGVVISLHDVGTFREVGQVKSEADGMYGAANYEEFPCHNCFLQVDRDSLLEAGYVISAHYQNGVQVNGGSAGDFDQLNGRTTPFVLADLLNGDRSFDLGLVKIPQCAFSYDIALALDVSENLGDSEQSELDHLTYFAQAFVRGFEIHLERTKIGVVGFAAANNPVAGVINSRIEIDLDRYSNHQDLIAGIGSISRTSDRRYDATSLWEGLDLSRRVLLRGRPNVRDVIVLVTDFDDNEEFGNGNPIIEAGKIKPNAAIFVVLLRRSPQTTAVARKIMNYIDSIPTDNVPPYVIGNIPSAQNLLEVAAVTINSVCGIGAAS